MAYTKQTWADLPSKTTPINASRLGHIEDGIYDAAATADNAASTAGSLASRVGIAEGKITNLEQQKVDKETGKGLSTNDYSNAEKAKVGSIAPTEDDSISASTDYEVGEEFFLSDGLLYEATSPISQGSAIIVYPTSGYNCKLSDSVTGQIKAVKDGLGTASTKNSTSVVTSSSDLVESGAVKSIVGWGNKNLLDPSIISASSSIIYVPIYVGLGQFTCSSDAPRNSTGGANLFLLAGNVSDGAASGTNGVYINVSRTVESVDGYVTIASRNLYGVDVRNYNSQLEKGSTATAYEPYHPTVDAQKADNSVIGTVEDGTKPTKSYEVDEFMVRDGAFCQVTAPVTTSSTWTEGSNYTKKSIAEVLQYLMS